MGEVSTPTTSTVPSWPSGFTKHPRNADAPGHHEPIADPLIAKADAALRQGDMVRRIGAWTGGGLGAAAGVAVLRHAPIPKPLAALAAVGMVAGGALGGRAIGASFAPQLPSPDGLRSYILDRQEPRSGAEPAANLAEWTAMELDDPPLEFQVSDPGPIEPGGVSRDGDAAVNYIYRDRADITRASNLDAAIDEAAEQMLTDREPGDRHSPRGVIATGDGSFYVTPIQELTPGAYLAYPPSDQATHHMVAKDPNLLAVVSDAGVFVDVE